MCSVINDIKTNQSLLSLINEIRSIEDKKERNKLKTKLPAIVTAGFFDGKGRKLNNIKDYNGVVTIDYDKLSSDVIKEALLIVNKNPYTLASFVSPSGNGFKVLVSTDSLKENHWHSYQEVSEYYNNLISLEADKVTKDITRLCYLPYDQNAFYNSDSRIFNCSIPLNEPIKKIDKKKSKVKESKKSQYRYEKRDLSSNIINSDFKLNKTNLRSAFSLVLTLKNIHKNSWVYEAVDSKHRINKPLLKELGISQSEYSRILNIIRNLGWLKNDNKGKYQLIATKHIIRDFEARIDLALNNSRSFKFGSGFDIFKDNFLSNNVKSNKEKIDITCVIANTYQRQKKTNKFAENELKKKFDLEDIETGKRIRKSLRITRNKSQFEKEILDNRNEFKNLFYSKTMTSVRNVSNNTGFSIGKSQSILNKLNKVKNFSKKVHSVEIKGGKKFIKEYEALYTFNFNGVTFVPIIIENEYNNNIRICFGTELINIDNCDLNTSEKSFNLLPLSFFEDYIKSVGVKEKQPKKNLKKFDRPKTTKEEFKRINSLIKKVPLRNFISVYCNEINSDGLIVNPNGTIKHQELIFVKELTDNKKVLTKIQDLLDVFRNETLKKYLNNTNQFKKGNSLKDNDWFLKNDLFKDFHFRLNEYELEELIYTIKRYCFSKNLNERFFLLNLIVSFLVQKF